MSTPLIWAMFICLFWVTHAGNSLAQETQAVPLTTIVNQQRQLQTDIDKGTRSGLNPRQVNVIRKAQEEVFALTDGKTSIDQLSIDQKTHLENALERINAEVKGGNRVATDETNVCWHERKTGSTVKVTRCGTKAERDQVRQAARDWMEKPRICTPPGCG